MSRKHAEEILMETEDTEDSIATSGTEESSASEIARQHPDRRYNRNHCRNCMFRLIIQKSFLSIFVAAGHGAKQKTKGTEKSLQKG